MTPKETSPADDAPRRLGLVAGGGRFPFLVAESATSQGIEVICAGLRREASAELAAVCHEFRWLGLGRLGATIRYFKKHGVKEVSWAGWIRKERLFHPWRILHILPDWRLVRLYLFKVRNRQTSSLLRALAEEFESEGIHVTHSTKYCPQLLAEEGNLTHRKPTRAQLDDIRFGWGIAKRLADLDVGQSVAVHELSTLAVEGIEGTDQNIRRAGEYCRRGGFTVVKLAKESHDMRFDVPTIGPTTVEALRIAGGAVLAVEAGKTMILDREATIEAAERHGIVIVAYRQPPDAE